ncbi:MAG: AsmA-like C-terminal region-containing protein [Opitutales bacterium]
MINKVLLILLTNLIGFYFVQDIKIRIPNFISNALINLIWDSKDFVTDHQELHVTISGDVIFSDLRLNTEGGSGLFVKNGKIKLNPISFIDNTRNPLENFDIRDISLISPELSKKQLNINCFRFNFIGENQWFYEIDSNLFDKSFKSKGVFKTIAREQHKKPKSLNIGAILTEISQFGQKAEKYLNQLSAKNFFNKVKVENRLAGFNKIESISEPVQQREFHFDLTSSTSLLSISEDFTSSSASISVGELLLEVGNQSLSSRNFRGKINFKDSSLKSISLKFRELDCDGKIKGKLDPFDLQIRKKIEHSNLLLFSNSKGFKSSLRYQNGANKKSVRGFLHLKPNALKISCNKNGNELKIVAGDSLKVNFDSNQASTDESFPTLYSVIAKNFSVLDAPKGNYYFGGEIKNDLSIEVRNATGLMGRSYVQGTYTQKWNPHEYEFRLKGYCYPQDINNWLGLWWSNLWKNFSFPAEIPYGDFRISGIWAGPVGNSRTFGIVDAKEFIYKGFKSKGSTILAKVDGNETLIESQNISHDFGELEGSLNFPRKHKKSPTFLFYSLDGSYPLNQARSIFGEEFESAIEDINATSIFCSASGHIPSVSQQNSSESEFSLKLQSREPVRFKGIEISNFNGQITKKSSLIEGGFPKLQIANGFGQLNIEIDSNGSEEISKINFKLRDANKNLLFQDLITAKKQGYFDVFGDQEDEFVSNKFESPGEGILNLSLQAEGPISNPLQFEGTGMIQLNEPKIGQINLLGKISEGLSNLKIPLPSGAFSFNELIIPFKLNNETMSFDNLQLTGPISKISSKGSFNLSSGTIDIIAKLSLIGNLPLPLIKNLVQLADPISRMAEIKITGNFSKPKWELLLSNN